MSLFPYFLSRSFFIYVFLSQPLRITGEHAKCIRGKELVLELLAEKEGAMMNGGGGGPGFNNMMNGFNGGDSATPASLSAHPQGRQ